MKPISCALRPALAAVLFWSTNHALANPAPLPQSNAMDGRPTRCELRPPYIPTLQGALESSGRGLMKSHIRDVGTFHVPRDAKVGTVIANLPALFRVPDSNNLVLYCWAYDGVQMNLDVRAVYGVNPPLPLVDAQHAQQSIIKTNVPGVGAIIEFYIPFEGTPDQWVPDSLPATVPFKAYYNEVALSGSTWGSVQNKIKLIKTGELPNDENYLDGPLATGHLDFNNMGKIMEFTLRGRIVQSQCEAYADAVSANPVKLGEWSTKDFTGPGFTTTATPFQIRLNNCRVDPDPGNQTLATIELEGRDGSQPIGPASENVFSLTRDSDAQGMGIQMLYDGKPMPLNKELDLVPVQDGSMPLNFEARFYQTEPNHAVRAGIAKGALNFTLRYR